MSDFTFTGRLDIAVDFGATDEIVREVSIENAHTTEPSTMKNTL